MATKTDYIDNTGKASPFKTFPEFSKLTFTDKAAYEKMIVHFPPLTDISFATLAIWWDSLDSRVLALLNGNIVLSYWLPGDERNSGLSLIGSNRVDESFCTIFDHLKERGEPARLVHVPEFVVGNMKHPELYNFSAEPDYDECVYTVSNFYPLNHATEFMRTNVERFLAKVDEKRIVTRSIDLRHRGNRQLLLESSQMWLKKGNFNDIGKIDRDAIKVAINYANELAIENVCIFIDGQLAGFQLYDLPFDKRYVIGTFISFDGAYKGAEEYLIYACAKLFSERGISYINYEMDLGLQRLRAQKLSLGPSTFFRQYTVVPAT